MNEDGARLFCFNWITRVTHRPGDVMENLPELKTLESNFLNPDLLINLKIKFMRTTSNI